MSNVLTFVNRGLSTDSLAQELFLASLDEDANSRITVLNLSGNKLTSLPLEVFTTFPNLENLDASENLLTTIPEEIFLLQKLEALNLATNNLRSVPGTVSYLPKLDNFFLEENPSLPNGLEVGAYSLTCRKLQDLALSLFPPSTASKEKYEQINLIGHGSTEETDLDAILRSLNDVEDAPPPERERVAHSAIITNSEFVRLPRCYICGRKFPEEQWDMQESHSEVCPGNQWPIPAIPVDLICPFCNCKFPSAERLGYHMPKCNGSECFPCPDPTCDAPIYGSAYILAYHMPGYHDGLKPYTMLASTRLLSRVVSVAIAVQNNLDGHLEGQPKLILR